MPRYWEPCKYAFHLTASGRKITNGYGSIADCVRVIATPDVLFTDFPFLPFENQRLPTSSCAKHICIDLGTFSLLSQHNVTKVHEWDIHKHFVDITKNDADTQSKSSTTHQDKMATQTMKYQQEENESSSRHEDESHFDSRPLDSPLPSLPSCPVWWQISGRQRRIIRKSKVVNNELPILPETTIVHFFH